MLIYSSGLLGHRCRSPLSIETCAFGMEKCIDIIIEKVKKQVERGCIPLSGDPKMGSSHMSCAERPDINVCQKRKSIPLSSGTT